MLQPPIRHDGVTDRRRWESALFLKVRDEIQTGNLAIDGAKNFGRFEAFFLPVERWEEVREAPPRPEPRPVGTGRSWVLAGCSASIAGRSSGMRGSSMRFTCGSLLERKHRAVAEATALLDWGLAPVWQRARAELGPECCGS